jgi:aryl-alcohol dehydrogenase-like predicted oxidoreductase
MSEPGSNAGQAAGRVTLGGTGLTVSRIGFGCYRVDDQTAEHRAALEQALDSGCTLIDTSTNYTDGASERLVGEALSDLRRRDPARRDAVTVVSKIGYVQGQNMILAMERERKGRPFPDMVRYMDGCWHCIHPEFLADQLERSRRRLQVETLDVCLLHNPEYFLSDAHKRRDGDLPAVRDAFYARLRDAFAFLEERVRSGEIRFYGVSSNSAVHPPDDPEATSLSRMLEAAAAAGGAGHHFRVLQIPMNLFESGGATVRNTGPGNSRTVLQEAAEQGIGVLINRPLNAFVGNRLRRLASPEVPPPRVPMAAAASTLRALEMEHRNGIAPRVGRAATDAAGQLFQLIDQVVDLAPQVEDLVHWRQIEQQYVIPRVNFVAAAVAKGIAEGERTRWRAWWGHFSSALQDLLYDIGRQAAEKSRAPAMEIAAALDPGLPPGRRAESLSRKALWVLASTPGVSCVLVGMRSVPYVADAMAVADWPGLDDAAAVYDRMEKA